MKGLKMFRIGKGFTQIFLSQELGISLAAYRNYEQGRREPNIETLKKMATFFECTIDDLL